MVFVQLTWPDGSVAFFSLLTYCTLGKDVLNGTRARLVSEEAAKKNG